MWYTVFGTNKVFDSFESSRSTNKTPPLTASGNMCKKAVGRLINFSIDDDMRRDDIDNVLLDGPIFGIILQSTDHFHCHQTQSCWLCRHSRGERMVPF